MDCFSNVKIDRGPSRLMKKWVMAVGFTLECVGTLRQTQSGMGKIAHFMHLPFRGKATGNVPDIYAEVAPQFAANDKQKGGGTINRSAPDFETESNRCLDSQ